jgi:hypothetical protein
MPVISESFPKMSSYPNISLGAPRNFYFPPPQVQSVSLVPRDENYRKNFPIVPFTCPLCKENFVHHQILNEHLRKLHAVLI